MTFSVRLANRGDLATLVEFNTRLAEESENRHLDRQVVEQGVAALLDDETKGFYIVAEENGEVIGQVMVTYEWSDWRNSWIWWLQSVYVKPSHRRRGVFRGLLQSVIDTASNRGDVSGVRLYVEKDNAIGQVAYHRCGFDEMPFRLMSRAIHGPRAGL
jgi:GNAT superfamily N-acetyltransferase